MTSLFLASSDHPCMLKMMMFSFLQILLSLSYGTIEAIRSYISKTLMTEWLSNMDPRNTSASKTRSEHIIICTLKELVLIENLVSFARLPSYYPWILGRSERIMWWGSFVTYEASARKCFHPDSKSIAHKSFVKTLSTPWVSFIFQSSSLLQAS